MATPIPEALSRPPAVGAQEMRRLDYWAMREFQVSLPVMLEHAGRAFAELLIRRFAPGRKEPILTLAGKGGNGGGAVAASRHLFHRGYNVTIVTTEPFAKVRDETRRQIAMYRKEGGSAIAFDRHKPLPSAKFHLDGILGYGLTESPRGTPKELIARAAEQKATTLALDLPSGLHADTGTPGDPTVAADATLALALPKKGLLVARARKYVGELYLADVAFPRVLYDDLDTTPEAIFGDEFLVRLP